MSIIDRVDNNVLVTREIDLEVEELEQVIAPFVAGANETHTALPNHNEILVSDEVELSAEELEDVIAPRYLGNNPG